VLTANLKEQHLQSPQSAAVDYTLSVTVSARTWKFRKPKVFPAFRVPVTIWPRRFGWTIPKRVPENNPRVYHAEGYLDPGVDFPAGIQAFVYFEAPENADLVVEVPDFRASPPDTPSPPDNGRRSFGWNFTSPPLTKYLPREFEIKISPKSGAEPPKEWNTVADSLGITFQE
jgi:hypothetical protein